MKRMIVSVLLVLIIAPALLAAEISYTGNIAWWGDLVKKENNPAIYWEHNSWPGGINWVGAWGDLHRGFICCNWAGNMTDPVLTFGIYNTLVSAELKMDMTYVHQVAGFGQPGVRAEWIYQADTTWGGDVTVGDPDWDAPAGMDLGWLVAPGDVATGLKTIDITSALQQASDEFIASGGVRPYFYIRLRVGWDTDGSNPDAQGDLNTYYVFNTSGSNPPGTGFNMTLSDTDPDTDPEPEPEPEPDPDFSDTGSFRIMVEFDTGTGVINNDPVRLDVAFQKILEDMGVDGLVDLDSVRVFEYDKATGDEKYEIPFRLFYASHTHSLIATNYLSWTRQNADSCLFAITFDLMDGTPTAGPGTFPMIGGGEPIIASSSGLDANGLASRFTVGDMTGDLVEDFVAGGYNEMGYVQMSRNLGTRANPIFSNWKRLETSSGEFVNERIFEEWPPGGYMIPKVHDFDSDGDLDLYADCNPWYAATTSYHENIGGFYKPVFKRDTLPSSPPADTKGAWSGRADWDGDSNMEMVTSSVRTLKYEGSDLFDLPDAISQICAYDWDNDIDKDIIVMTHGGTMYFSRNNGSASFSLPEVVPAQNANLSSGAFSTPWAADWDGDGDLDLFSGNEAGQILYHENIGSRFDPDYVRSGFVEVGGTRIDYPGDFYYGGSYNGTEGTWGYSMPTIIDWDGDGDLDLIGSERLGFHNYYENIGDSTTPVLAAAVRLKYSFNGSPIETDHRVRPAIFDWDNDGDLDLIMTHTNGYASIYKNTNAPDKITFLLPQTLYNPSAQPIFTELYDAQGRTKYAPIDWDGDGDKDLMTTDHILNYWPKYFENVGTVSSPQFIERDERKVKGTRLWVEASHEMAICPIDWDNDGREDILLGGEDGHVYYFNRKMFDPQPALVSATIQNLNTGDEITSQLDDYFDVDTRAQAGEIIRDDLNLTSPSPPGSGWSWSSSTSFMHNNDMLAIWDANGTEQVTFSPGLTGVYDIYVGLRHVSNPTGLKLALTGDLSWYTISLSSSGGDDGFYQRHWKKADMTGKDIYILPVAGTTVYFDFLKFVPAAGTYLPVYDISYIPGTVTLKCRHLSGNTYNIYYADGPPNGEPDWLLASGNVPASASGNLEWTDSGDTVSGRPAPDAPSVKQRCYIILETGP